jgi:hypothetical protein
MTSFAAVQQALELGLIEPPAPRPVQLNCPVVGRGVVLEVGGGMPAMGPPSLFYYKGMAVSVYGVGVSPTEADFVSMPINNLFMLRREGEEMLSEPARHVDITGDGDRLDSNNILEATRADGPAYTPLLRTVHVTVPTGTQSIDSLGETDAQFRRASDLFEIDQDALTPVPGNVVAYEITDRPLCNCPVQRMAGGL